MELRLTPAAQEFLQKQFQGNPAYLLLDYLDGDSPFNDQAIGCQLYDNYRLILLDQQHEAINWDFYDLVLETELAPLHLKPKYEMLLDPHVVIDYDPRYLSLTMRGDSGILVPRLSHLVIK